MGRVAKSVIVTTLLAVVISVGPGLGRAESMHWKFTKIIDLTGEGTQPRIGPFIFFDEASISGPDIIFSATRVDLRTGPIGIYSLIDGAFQKIAEDGTAPFVNIRRKCSISDGNVAFLDSDTGIYIGMKGKPVQLIADLNTYPGLWKSSTPSISGTSLVFEADGKIYLRSGAANTAIIAIQRPYKVGDSQREIQFTSLSSPEISGENIVFRAIHQEFNESTQKYMPVSGIYRFANGHFFVVSDTNTPIPNGTGNFVSFEPQKTGDMFSISGDNVVFFGKGSDGQEGIYTKFAGKNVECIADNRADHGSRFWNPSIFGEGVVFNGLNLGIVGIDKLGPSVYSSLGGSITTVLARGDLIDGKRVASAWTSGQAFDGNSVVLTVHFDDQTYGIYRAELLKDDERATRGCVARAVQEFSTDGFRLRPQMVIEIRCPAEIDPMAVQFSTEVYLDLLELNHPHEPREARISRIEKRRGLMAITEKENAIKRAKILLDYANAIEKATAPLEKR